MQQVWAAWTHCNWVQKPNPEAAAATFKLPTVCGGGQPTDISTAAALVGKPTVIDALIEGRSIPALLDTGATVSVIKDSVVTQLGLSISPVMQLLQIECANGQQLPYVGCVVADTSFFEEIAQLLG